MASTDFLQINPAAVNQQNDTTYAADATRLGGFAANAILPSPLANKMLYQSAAFVSAFAQMMQNKGTVILDGSPGSGGTYAGLVSALSTVRLASDFEASIAIVAYSSSITFNAAASAGFVLTLTGNVSASTITGTSPGQILTFFIIQDSAGGRQFPWPSAISGTVPICPQPFSMTMAQFDVLPSGAIVPIGLPLWMTASGVFSPPPPGSVVQIATNGNCSNQLANLTEEVNTASGPITRNLYSAVGYQGFAVTIKNLPNPFAANAVLVQPVVGTQKIDTFANITVPAYNSRTFVSDGANWIVT